MVLMIGSDFDLLISSLYLRAKKQDCQVTKLQFTNSEFITVEANVRNQNDWKRTVFQLLDCANDFCSSHKHNICDRWLK